MSLPVFYDPPYSRGRYIQRGSGFANLLTPLFRWIMPIMKKAAPTIMKTGKTILSHPSVKDIAKNIGNDVAKSGISYATHLLAGNDTDPNFKADVQAAKYRLNDAIKTKGASELGAIINKRAAQVTSTSKKKKSAKKIAKKLIKKPVKRKPPGLRKGNWVDVSEQKPSDAKFAKRQLTSMKKAVIVKKSSAGLI